MAEYAIPPYALSDIAPREAKAAPRVLSSPLVRP